MKNIFKEAILYEKLNAGAVRCDLCEHKCVILPAKGSPNLSIFPYLKKENMGFCGTRTNINGILYSLTYGKVTSLAVDPVEKKPLYHFFPGENLLSFGSFGCNFRCPNCHNWQISQTSSLVHTKPESLNSILENFSDISPAEIVNQAVENNCIGIAYTYNEPTISIEFVMDVMKLAKKAKIKNVWITNGFFSDSAREEIFPYIDAMNVDLKSFDQRFYQSHPKGKLSRVLANLIKIKESDIHLEVTTLIIPKFSNNENMLRGIASFIKNKLSRTTPWHLLDFSPEISWQMQSWQKTSEEEIKKAYEIGKKEGLKFVYASITNLANTICPHCKAINIERRNYQIDRFDENGGCFKCGQNLHIRE